MPMCAFTVPTAAIMCFIRIVDPNSSSELHAASAIANFNAVRIEAPYLYASKAEILADGWGMGLDYAETWTCYQGGERACGECGSCRERLAAFAEQGLTDPLTYRSASMEP